MPTTANYGWTIPADTDLVKDGAAAIRTLGNAIDTTAASTFTGGLVKINTTSFTAVSSQSVNDVFSTNYSHYLIHLELTNHATADADLYLKLRVSGTDSSTNYNQVRFRVNGTGGTTSQTNISNGTAGFHVGEADSNGGPYFNSQIDVISPFETQVTGIKHLFGSVDVSQNTIVTTGAGHHSVSSSYTGFTIIATGGTMTGTIRVYGYKK